MPNIVREFRYALRGFRKNPILAVAALLSLALGIGAKTAIFSLTDQVLLRVWRSRNLTTLVLFSARGGRAVSSRPTTTTPTPPVSPVCDFRDRAPALAGVIARFPMSAQPERRRPHRTGAGGPGVGGTYFGVLGAGMVLGRPLTPDDDRRGSPNEVAVLSYVFWKNRFARRPRCSIKPFAQWPGGEHRRVAQPGSRASARVKPSTLPPHYAAATAVVNVRWHSEPAPGYWLNIFARLRPGMPAPADRVGAECLLAPILKRKPAILRAPRKNTGRDFAARH